MRKQIATMLAVLPVVACAGPVERLQGAYGPVLTKGAAVAVNMLPPLGDEDRPTRPDPAYAASSARARAEVVAALRRHGLVVDDRAAIRIDVSYAARPAASGVRLAGGEVLSPATHRWALQSCYHTTFRLSLAYAQRDPRIATGRGSAEESRCHDDTANLLPRLADRAVTVLLDEGN